VDRRLESSRLSAAKTKLRSINIEEVGIMMCDASTGSPQVMFVSAAWSQLTGITSDQACCKTLWELFSVPGKAIILRSHYGNSAFALWEFCVSTMG
jgi:hypothetical protein